ncbi:MAG: hypothetical protein NC417_13060 [Candidatus Gastranaerophilales bacterium]|nr:hypothetical protein [Candidatus Gastranaerophilales bacterium]
MKKGQYRVEIAESGKQDVKNIKEYILEHFQYRELGENFSKKIKKQLWAWICFRKVMARRGLFIVDMKFI